jgi:O-antigen ligase
LIWNVTAYKIYPIDILIIITILSFFYHKLISKTKIRVSRVGAYLLVYVGFALLSMIYGIYNGGDSAIAFSTFKNYALYSIFFFIVINIIRDRKQMDRLVKTFLISGIFVIIFIAIGIFTGAGLWIEYTPLSTEGTRLLAPTHAFYLAVAILISINLIAYKINYFGRLTVPIILVQLLGVIVSLTRHLWLALAFTLLLTFIFLRREYKANLLKVVSIQVAFIIVLIVFYALFSFIITGSLPSVGEEFLENTITRLQSIDLAADDESAYFRILAWEKAWDIFSDNPVLGIGFGHKLTFDFFGWPITIQMRELHNNFIGIAVQMGIIGFLSFLAYNFIFLKQSYRLLRKIKGEIGAYLMGFLGCYVIFMFSANFGTYFDINVNVIFYWIFIGAVVAIRNIVKTEKQNLVENKTNS